MSKLLTKTIVIALIASVFLISAPVHYLFAQKLSYDYNFQPEVLDLINPAINGLIKKINILNPNSQTADAGQLILPEAQIKSEPRKIKKLIITAYSSTPDQTDSTPFITASGSTVYFGTAAANCLPFATRIRIPEIFNEQIFAIKDTMHSRFACRIDIWLPTRQEALDFGVKRSEVYIY